MEPAPLTKPLSIDDRRNLLVEADLYPEERLGIFLSDIVGWLHVIIEARFVLSYDEMRGPLVSARDETVEIHFGTVVEGIMEADNRLSDAGLTGQALNAKMTGYTRSANRFWRRGGLKAMASWFGWVNTILSSLAAAVPGAHVFVELKETTEHVVNDTIDGF